MEVPNWLVKQVYLWIDAEVEKKGDQIDANPGCGLPTDYIQGSEMLCDLWTTILNQTDLVPGESTIDDLDA